MKAPLGEANRAASAFSNGGTGDNVAFSLGAEVLQSGGLIVNSDTDCVTQTNF